MLQTIDTSQGVTLDWSAKGSQRKAQNVMNLLNTWRYDVAYNRVMGLNPKMVDKPAPIMAALYTADVYRLVQEYQPNVTVKSVKVRGVNENGQIDAEVVIEV